MKKLVIAEKPSVGRAISSALFGKSDGRGFIEGDDYIVTWALGHLIELCRPSHYDPEWKRWSLSALPMLPEALEETVIESTKEQYGVIEGLLSRPDISSVVVATDAGREGELVARWILKKAGYKGVAERLWIQSQTVWAIRDGFMNLRPLSDYDNLYKAAECRAAADWYIGMNVSRALTCFHDARISAGRVQTPTLRLICSREDEIESFEGTFYYTARANFGTFFASLTTDDGYRFTDESLAKELESWTEKEGIVISMKREEKNIPIPLAYDLTELQRDANSSFGFSASLTLSTLQKLYEGGYVTYPRTSSRYITRDVAATIGERIKAIRDTEFSAVCSEYLKNGFRNDNPRFVCDEGVTDHHAIIPTEKVPDTGLFSEGEKKIWELIVLRFLEVLSDDYVYESTVSLIDVEGRVFKSMLSEPVKKGFRWVAESCGMKKIAEEEVFDGLISSLKEGDSVKLKGVKVSKSATKPPERYTDGTLLYAMEHAGRFVDDSEIKRNLSNGLGTPATRAEIIEKLIQNRYAERSGKSIIPTPMGREVVRLSPNALKSPELTGVWEGRLDSISRGEEDPEVFLRDIKKMASSLVSEVIMSKQRYSPVFKDSKKCPCCGSGMMKANDADGTVHYICLKLSCGYEEKEVKVRIDAPIRKSSDGKVIVSKSRNPGAYVKRTEVVKNGSRRPAMGDSEHRHSKSDDTGGTMADFFKLSEERRKRDRNNRTRR